MDKIVLAEREFFLLCEMIRERIAAGEILVNGSSHVEVNEDGEFINLVTEENNDTHVSEEKSDSSPEVPSKGDFCFINVPYRGYLIPEEDTEYASIPHSDKVRFKEACVCYYTDSGYDVYNAIECNEYVTITMVRRDFSKKPDKSVIEYMNTLK